MERLIKVYEVDAFTSTKGLGNPAGVVPEADGLSAEEMQEIAKVLGHSETAFVLKPDGDDHDFIVRFFTPEIEMPICGHATIATNYTLAVIKDVKETQTVLQKSGVGILPIEIIPIEDGYTIKMMHDEVKLSAMKQGEPQRLLLQALGLLEEDLDSKCPMQIASNGPKAIIGIKSKEKLNSLNPDLEALKQLSPQLECVGFFIFTFDSDDVNILTHSRYFAPSIGIDEDPVTGTGHGPLSAYLIANNLVEHDGKFFSFTGQQGEAIGKTGHVRLSVDMDEGEIRTIKVAGNAVISSEQEMRV